MEPCPTPVDGAELLDGIRAVITRYMVLPKGAAEALTLWIVGTYVFDAFQICAKLLITSPEKRCGKSTLLAGILPGLVHRAIVASNISSAAVYRVIDAVKPTLLIDEADTFLANNPELRGVINSGHMKVGAVVWRLVGDSYDPKPFSTWGPMAIAMIKAPPDTIVDRAVTIRLRRRRPGEQVVKLPLTFEEDCLALRQRCTRWGADNFETLRSLAPDLPTSDNDRALDNWSPLFAIAQAAGNQWPGAALVAFQLLSVEAEGNDVGRLLFADVKQVFEERQAQTLHSVDLTAALVNLEDRPWSEWRHGKPLTTNGLSKLLGPYEIRSKQIRIANANRNGYTFASFQDAFSRYLDTPQGPPPAPTSTTLHANGGAELRPDQNSTQREPVEFSSPEKPSSRARCRVVEVGAGGVEEGLFQSSVPQPQPPPSPPFEIEEF